MHSSLERTRPRPKHGAVGARRSPIILGANRLTPRRGYTFRWLKNTSDASDQPLPAEEEQEEADVGGGLARLSEESGAVHNTRSELRQQPRQAAGSDPPFFPRTLAARTPSYTHFATLHSGEIRELSFDKPVLFGGPVAELPRRGVSLRAPTVMGRCGVLLWAPLATGHTEVAGLRRRPCILK